MSNSVFTVYINQKQGNASVPIGVVVIRTDQGKFHTKFKTSYSATVKIEQEMELGVKENQP